MVKLGKPIIMQNYDIIPVFYDLFQKQFPQLIGQVIILNYGWLHAGIWGLVKSTLSEDASSRVLFVENSNLVSFLDAKLLPPGG